MNCPKCGKPVGDHDAICPNCGTELFIDTALADKIFSRSSAPLIEDKTEKDKKKHKLPDIKKHLKLILIAAAVIVVIVLAVIIIVSVTSNKGEKIAEKTSDFIGADFDVAEKKLDAKFKQESAYKGLSNVIDYDRVAESDGSVKVDGVTYPEWAALVKLDDEGRIITVKYADFESLKDDIKGYKKEHIVNLDKFDVGSSRSSIEKELDMDFYSVTFSKDGAAYVYRYWYENDSGDVQPVVLTVNFDNDGDYTSYSSVLLYHQFM